MTGISPNQRGVPEISITFEIDINGIIKVSAEDKSSGNKEKLSVKIDTNKSMIDHMIKDAEMFADEDKKLIEQIEYRNELESFAYSLDPEIEDEDKDEVSTLETN